MAVADLPGCGDSQRSPTVPRRLPSPVRRGARPNSALAATPGGYAFLPVA